MNQEELNVLERMSYEFSIANDKNTVEKLYRQARNWSRFHCYFAKACSPETCKKLNTKFKIMKNERLQEVKNGIL